MCYKHKAGRNICIARDNRTLQDSPVLKVLWRITETFLPPKAYRAGPALPPKAEDFNNFLAEPANASWLNAQHGNQGNCAGCPGRCSTG